MRGCLNNDPQNAYRIEIPRQHGEQYDVQDKHAQNVDERESVFARVRGVTCDALP